MGDKKPEQDDPAQSRRFIDTAETVDTEQARANFERAFGVVAGRPRPDADKSKDEK